MHTNTPPMGWNTWNTFAENISEKLIMEAADAMVAEGLLDAGYQYLVIDDLWSMPERDENGRIVPNPEKFPHGMKYVADYVHSKGLKFGMYSCAGYLTCCGFPGSYDNEWVDAQTFAEWGVDFLKYDFCYNPLTVRPDTLYKRMSLALANTGRDIIFSACSWGALNTKQWIKETGADMWRSTIDISDSWDSIKSLAQSQLVTMEYNGKGCFNDMDMLVVGMNGRGNVGFKGCSTEEYRTHFSLWALMNSPLIIGCDIREMDETTKQILLNKEVIAINQDPKGCSPYIANRMAWEINEVRKPGDNFYKSYPVETPILVKYLDNGDIAIGVFNFSDSEIGGLRPPVTFDNLAIPLNSGMELEATNLWTGEVIRSSNGTLKLDTIAPHDCRLFRARFVEKKK